MRTVSNPGAPDHRLSIASSKDFLSFPLACGPNQSDECDHRGRGRERRLTKMTTFTIDADNNITVFPTSDHAEAAIAAGAQSFTSQTDLAKLTAEWPATRLAETWNGFAGVAPFSDLKPVKKFTDRKSAIARIWQAVQKLAPSAERADVAQQGAQDATGAAGSTTTSTRKTKPPKAPKTSTKAKGKGGAKAAKVAKPKKTAGARDGSKTAQVVEMLKRKNGATLEEVMEKMGWQKHTVRGFMAGAMKKAGYEVESFKSEKGERTYRINE
jgi:hypothetical protein